MIALESDVPYGNAGDRAENLLSHGAIHHRIVGIVQCSGDPDGVFFDAQNLDNFSSTGGRITVCGMAGRCIG